MVAHVHICTLYLMYSHHIINNMDPLKLLLDGAFLTGSHDIINRYTTYCPFTHFP